MSTLRDHFPLEHDLSPASLEQMSASEVREYSTRFCLERAVHGHVDALGEAINGLHAARDREDMLGCAASWNAMVENAVRFLAALDALEDLNAGLVQ